MAGSALRLAAGHRHFDHRAAPICATELGYFQSEAMEAPSVEATGEDDNTIARLRDGSIDIALDISPAKVLSQPADLDMVIIGSMCNGIGQVLTGIPGLMRVEDLRGKRIHVVEQGSGVDWHPLRLLLRQRGINPDRDVQLVYKAPYPLFQNGRKALEAGIADARMLLHAEVPHIVAAGFPVLYDFLAAYPADYPQRMIVTTRRFLTRDPERIEPFLRVIVRGYRYLRDPANYQDAMKILRARITDPGLGFPPGITDHFLNDHYFGFKQMPANGGTSMESLQRYIDEEVSEGRIATTLRAGDVMDDTLVRRAAATIDQRHGIGTYA